LVLEVLQGERRAEAGVLHADLDRQRSPHRLWLADRGGRAVSGNVSQEING
jgi:hypothetical protein